MKLNELKSIVRKLVREAIEDNKKHEVLVKTLNDLFYYIYFEMGRPFTHDMDIEAAFEKYGIKHYKGLMTVVRELAKELVHDVNDQQDEFTFTEADITDEVIDELYGMIEKEVNMRN